MRIKIWLGTFTLRTPSNPIHQYINTQPNEKERQELLHGETYSEHSMKQEDNADDQQCQAPCERVAVKPSSHYIFSRIGRQPRTKKLRRATGVYRSEEPRAGETQNEKQHAVRYDGHLKETRKDCKLHDGF